MRYLTRFALCVLLPSLAIAQEDDEETVQHAEIDQVGMSLAVGAGYGFPTGRVYSAPTAGSDTHMGGLFSGQVPLALSLGVRPIPHLSLGIALQYARLLTNDCTACTSSSATDTYVGLELRLHLLPDQPGCPWLAFGLGYEWLGLSKVGGQTGVEGYRGKSYDIEFGVDIRMTRYFGLGPFVGLRFGSYGTTTIDSDGSRDVPIPDDSLAMHAWWTFGLRGAFMVSKL